LPAEAGDLSKLAFRSKAHWGYSDQFMQACLEELTIGESYIINNPVFAIEIEAGVIGFYALEQVSASEAELGCMFIEPDFIGKGYGRRLMDHAKQQAFKCGYPKIMVLADPNAEKFYRAAGGILVGARPSASIPGRELPLLQIDLGRKEIQIMRGYECQNDPCGEIAQLADRLYGRQTALPVSLLRAWYFKNASIFRIATTSDGMVCGYISTLPLGNSRFEQTVNPDFQETSIQAEDIEEVFCPEKGGIFLSSIAVASEFQQQSPVSLMLRLAFVEDLVKESNRRRIRISAQAVSQKGQRCMESLGMQVCGETPSGWKIYCGQHTGADLHRIQNSLQNKLSIRLGM
jgi:N-acetylglutamate synthase-like GNAT family acetyltransferase